MGSFEGTAPALPHGSLPSYTVAGDINMHPAIASNLSEISALCRRFGVARLDLFGSATGTRFDPETSDFDLLVDFLPEAKIKAFDNYFGLREDLEQLLGRKVDLITASSVRNPYLQREIAQSRLTLYGA